MKKVLGILLIIALLAAIGFLAITKNMAQQRAARLDRALQEAEQRILELEAERETARSRASEPAMPTAPATPSVALAVSRKAMPTEEPGTRTSPANSTAPAVPTLAALPRVTFAATSGRGITNLVRIEGTSTVHDWQVEGSLIGGTVEFGPGLPGGPAPQTPPASLEAKTTAFIPVRSLKSIEQSGKPYSDAMDEIMYGKLKAEEHKRITFTLVSLSLKPLPEPSAKQEYEAVGQLTVAGVTNTITLPVSISAAPDGRVQISGSIATKMTDFGITPPAPSVGGLSIKTGDEVKLRFKWWVKPTQPSGTAK